MVRRWSLGTIATVATVAALLVVTAVPASAIPGTPGPPPGRGIDTDITMTGVAEGQGVRGGLPTGSEVSDPAVAYPATPPSGFVVANEDFAGIITARGAESETTLRLYCIDIRTNTYPGLGYENGSWEQAGMPNVGYVARLLNDYYPATNEPAAAPNANVRAAAVQAAIWYFTDYFVLASNDPVRPFTEAIVNEIRALPPLPFPEPPSLTITPADATGQVGGAAGPFTVNTDAAAGALVFAEAATMYSDASLSAVVAEGASVMNGQLLWVVPDDPAPGTTVTLLARGEATMPSGNVYIYDGRTTGVADAQRLILAETVDIITNVTATATFVEAPLSSLVVTKTIAGSAAGRQGVVTVRIACDNGASQDLELAAGATGSSSVTVSDLPVGTVCTLSEPRSGASDTVTVATTGVGSVIIAAGQSTVTITNTYAPGLAASGGGISPLSAAIGLLLLAAGTLLLAARRTARFARS